MQAGTRNGLIVGVAGMVINICVAAFVGFCGPFISLLAGAGAGYLTIQQEKATTKSDGARAGAISGAIAGALVLVGQLIGGVAALAFIQSSGIELPIGEVPDVASGGPDQAVYYLSGLATAFCFGVVGIALAAGAGAGAGYLGTTEGPDIIDA